MSGRSRYDGFLHPRRGRLSNRLRGCACAGDDDTVLVDDPSDPAIGYHLILQESFPFRRGDHSNESVTLAVFCLSRNKNRSDMRTRNWPVQQTRYLRSAGINGPGNLRSDISCLYRCSIRKCSTENHTSIGVSKRYMGPIGVFIFDGLRNLVKPLRITIDRHRCCKPLQRRRGDEQLLIESGGDGFHG